MNYFYENRLLEKRNPCFFLIEHVIGFVKFIIFAVAHYAHKRFSERTLASFCFLQSRRKDNSTSVNNEWNPF